VGSLVGIAVFAVSSWFSMPPIVWLGLLVLFALPAIPGQQRLASLLAFVTIGIAMLAVSGADIWSPYYRIHFEKESQGKVWEIWVNGIPHQSTDLVDGRPTFCYVPYDTVGDPPFRRVLIIGAGTGSDVAVALARGAESVDAVEIDPDLYQLGRRLHPEHPYDDPRVHVHIDDGRAFLRHDTGQYDLIILALTDSLVLTSSQANLRLESFLFTEESIASARAHLASDGLLVAYNYYREDWSIHRLAGMFDRAFGAPPFAVTFGQWGHAATFMAGPRLARLPAALDRPYGADPEYRPATLGDEIPVTGIGWLAGEAGEAGVVDDWPFFYLQERAIPRLYLAGLAMAAVVALLMIRWIAPPETLKRFSAQMFFLGAAFMGLEARSLVVFALLFGTTWLVNALVFFAILSGVLLAILIGSQWKPVRLWPLYPVLLLLLAANYFVPLAALLELKPVGFRYVLAAAFVFSPIFAANLIFAEAFAVSSAAPAAFAWNLIGIMAGGMLEYAALVIGYRNLIPVIALLYVAALAAEFGRRQRAATG
jgi:SAM-dependent methyltransferase